MIETLRPPTEIRPAAFAVRSDPRRPRLSWIATPLFCTVAFWSLGVTLAGMQLWAAVRADSMNADGVAYLDIAELWWSGEWRAAVNSVWSPLYSWVLAVMLGVARPAPAREFAAVQISNFCVFLFAFACFEFLLRELRNGARNRLMGAGDSPAGVLWLAVAYAVFLWSMLCLITIWAVTPDMLMAAWVLLAGALILRIRRKAMRLPAFSALGLVLGLAYLSKSVMFPLGFAFLAAAAAAHDRPRPWKALGLAAATFVLVCSPWILLISRAQDRWTFGDAGTVTYLRHVNGASPADVARKVDPAGARPAGHAVRQILEDPPVYAYRGPRGATYPPSFDPSAWQSAISIRFDARRQGAAIVRNGLFYVQLFSRELGGAVACALLVVLTGRAVRRGRTETARRAALLIPVAAAFGLYGLVYAESRYLAVFIILLWTEILSNLPRPGHEHAKLTKSAGVLALAFLGANILAFHGRGAETLAIRDGAAALDGAGPAPRHADVAEALAAMGVGAGESVAVIGYAFDSFWARVARVQIVAELPTGQASGFWANRADVRERVLDAFSAAGARAVVAEHVPARSVLDGWQRVGNSSFYVRLLGRADAPG